MRVLVCGGRDFKDRDLAFAELDILSFEAVFMPYMLTNDGRTLIERIATLDLLPPPSDENRPSVQ